VGIRDFTKACFKRKSGVLKITNRGCKLTDGISKTGNRLRVDTGRISKIGNRGCKFTDGISKVGNGKLKILKVFVGFFKKHLGSLE
jgi:hypothetical protein